MKTNRMLVVAYLVFSLLALSATDLIAQKKESREDMPFHLPHYVVENVLDLRIALVDGKRPESDKATLSVEGVATKVAWESTSSSIQTLQLNDRFFLLDDYKGFHTFLWDRVNKNLKEIEYLSFGAKSKYGRIAIQKLTKREPFVEQSLLILIRKRVNGVCFTPENSYELQSVIGEVDWLFKQRSINWR